MTTERLYLAALARTLAIATVRAGANRYGDGVSDAIDALLTPLVDYLLAESGANVTTAYDRASAEEVYRQCRASGLSHGEALRIAGRAPPPSAREDRA